MITCISVTLALPGVINYETKIKLWPFLTGFLL
jgi:hypothetical protein